MTSATEEDECPCCLEPLSSKVYIFKVSFHPSNIAKRTRTNTAYLSIFWVFALVFFYLLNCRKLFRYSSDAFIYDIIYSSYFQRTIRLEVCSHRYHRTCAMQWYEAKEVRRSFIHLLFIYSVKWMYMKSIMAICWFMFKKAVVKPMIHFSIKRLIYALKYNSQKISWAYSATTINYLQTIANRYCNSNKINIVLTKSGFEVAGVNAFVHWMISKLSQEASHIYNWNIVSL